ncbi:MAG: hypothetical protein R2777_06620 [Chitinophagales bacterium]
MPKIQKQIERFYHIFEDLQADVTFYPILIKLYMKVLPMKIWIVSIFTIIKYLIDTTNIKFVNYSKDKA